MNWLARLKAQPHRSAHATNATHSDNVAFVAPTAEANLTTERHPAAHLPQPGLCCVPNTSKATNATTTQSVAFVASSPSTKPTTGVQTGPDLCCWPHSSAMNTQEIATFIVRLEQFSRIGVSLAEAELLAERLVLRDRDEDDRQLCLECQHLQGDVGRWRCANAQRAGMAVGTANAPLPAGLTQQLQRCPGLKPSPAAIPAPSSALIPAPIPF